MTIEDAEIEFRYEYPTGAVPVRSGAYPGAPGSSPAPGGH